MKRWTIPCGEQIRDKEGHWVQYDDVVPLLNGIKKLSNDHEMYRSRSAIVNNEFMRMRNGVKDIIEKMNNGVLKETKLFEKIELKWFSPSDMKRRIHVFRPFYREIVKQILKDLPNISKFLKSKKRKNKTLKNKK